MAKTLLRKTNYFGMMMVRAMNGPNFRWGDRRFVRAVNSPLGIHPYARHVAKEDNAPQE